MDDLRRVIRSRKPASRVKLGIWSNSSVDEISLLTKRSKKQMHSSVDFSCTYTCNTGYLYRQVHVRNTWWYPGTGVHNHYNFIFTTSQVQRYVYNSTSCCCTVAPSDAMDQMYSRAACWCLQQIHSLTMCGSNCSLWVSVPFHPTISISTRFRPLFLAKNQSRPTNVNHWCSDDLATTIPFFLPKHCWCLTMYFSWNSTKCRSQPRNCPVLPMWSDLDWDIRTWNSSSSPVEYCPTRHGATATTPKAPCLVG